MVPKNPLAAAEDVRNFAKGHWAARNRPAKTLPQINACSQGFHRCVFGRSKSSATAGTMSKRGNSGGVNCVTGLNTGPSFGCAGNSGRIQMSDAVKSEYRDATIVAAQGCTDPALPPGRGSYTRAQASRRPPQSR